MDYSHHYPSILLMYFGILAGIIIGLVLLLMGARSLIRQYIESKGITKLAGAIAVVVCVILLAVFSVPWFKDIPNVINKNYIIITGTVVSWNSGGTQSEARGITLETDDGERIKVTVIYTPIREGERYEIIRLPNTPVGSVIRKIDDTELPDDLRRGDGYIGMRYTKNEWTNLRIRYRYSSL